ncbi:uncharacterized protein O3C94_018714 [Discoglossus pictus]
MEVFWVLGVLLLFPLRFAGGQTAPYSEDVTTTVLLSNDSSNEAPAIFATKSVLDETQNKTKQDSTEQLPSTVASTMSNDTTESTNSSLTTENFSSGGFSKNDVKAANNDLQNTTDLSPTTMVAATQPDSTTLVPESTTASLDPIPDQSDDHTVPSKGLPEPMGNTTDKEEPDSKMTTTNSYTTAPTSLPRSGKPFSLWVLVLVLIIIFAFILLIIMILLVRKKRRSGSQNFSKQSRRAVKQDVWAGQVPELAEGKPMRDAEVAENGAAVPMSGPGKEDELTTFVSGEKKVDSVIEMDDLARPASPKAKEEEKVEKKEDDEEQKPLLGEDSEGTPNGDVTGKEEQFPLPPPEQELMANMDKTI